MFVTCISTGSKGNSYALYDNDGKILLLDLGLPRKDILKAIDYRVSDVVGCVVTHSHLDHSKSIKDFEDMGIPIIAFYREPYKKYVQEKQYTVLDKNGNTKEISIFFTGFIKVGNFKVMGIQVPHNGAENYGFIIRADGQTIFYFTDFECCTPILASYKPNHMIVECNYQIEYVDRNSPNYEHKLRGHCSLDTCRDFITANKTSALRTVILCHMGMETAIAEECVAEVQKVSGSANVSVAKAGESLELSLYPF